MADVKIPPESIQNIASLYNGNTLVVDNIKVTGKISTNELDAKHKISTKEFKASDGCYGRFFALNGTHTQGEDLNVDGIFCKRGPHACLIVDDFLTVIGKTPQRMNWFDFKPNTQNININGHDLSLPRLISNNEIAGYLFRNVHGAYNHGWGSAFVILQSGHHDLSDDHRPIYSVTVLRGWKVTIKATNGSNNNKTFTYENRDQHFRSWSKLSQDLKTEIWRVNYTAQWVGF